MALIYCACGCGCTLEEYDKKHRPRIYILGHHNRIVRYWSGKKFDDEHKKKLADSKLEHPSKYWSGKEFSDEHKKKLSAAKKGKTGALCHNWIDGRTPKNRIIRNSLEMRAWKLSVFSRDGWKCVICGTKSPIHAHHIKKFSEYSELRFDVDNGVTLCKDCHMGLHKLTKKGRVSP